MRGGKTKGGCDCLGLVVGLMDEVYGTKITEYDHFNKATNMSKELVLPYLNKYFSISPSIKLGSIIFFSNRMYPIHFGIVSKANPDYIIHARDDVQRVTENIIDNYWRRSIHLILTPKVLIDD